jgi:hypothetical protein
MLRFSSEGKYFSIAGSDYIDVYKRDKSYLFTVKASSNYGFVEPTFQDTLFHREDQFYKMCQDASPIEDSLSFSLSTKDIAEQEILEQKTSGQEIAEQKTARQDTAGQETAGQDTAGQDTAGQKTAGQKTAGQKTTGQETAGQEEKRKGIPLEDMDIKYRSLIPTGKYEDINKVCGDYRAINLGSAYLNVYGKDEELFVIKMNTYRRYKEVFVVEFFVHEGQTLLVVNAKHGYLSIYNMKGKHLHDDGNNVKFITSFQLIDNEYILLNIWAVHPLFEQFIYKISSLLTMDYYSGKMLYAEEKFYGWENTVENGKIVMPSGDRILPSVLYEQGLYKIQREILLQENSFLFRLIRREHNINLTIDKDFLTVVDNKEKLRHTVQSRYIMNKLTHVKIDVLSLFTTFYGQENTFFNKNRILKIPLYYNGTHFDLIFTFTFLLGVRDDSIDSITLQISIEKRAKLL